MNRSTGVKIKIARAPARTRENRRASAGTRRTFWLVVTAAFLGAILLAGHIFWWYLPRPHPAQPRPDRLPAQLLASADFPFAVWMPHPHQNLAALARAASVSAGGSQGGDDPAPVAALPQALARLLGLPEPSLPSFGTLQVPPSSEIVFAADESGERFAIAAEVYPAMAAFAKLAGNLANNRWLRGGELTVDGRPIEVAWHGRVWTVASPALPELGEPEAASAEPPSLLVAEVRERVPPLPAARLHLRREDGDLVLRSTNARTDGLALEGPQLSDLGLFLLLLSGGDVDREQPVQAMAFFANDDPLSFSREGMTVEFPGMASVAESGGKRWTLPGESLLKWTGRRIHNTRLGNWEVHALDQKSFRRIQRLAPDLPPLLRPGGEDAIQWGLWFDLEQGHTEVSRIAHALEEIPLVSHERRQRWRDIATVLEPAARSFSRLAVVVTQDPPAFDLRLEGREEEP